MGLHDLGDGEAALLVAGRADLRIGLREPTLLHRPFGAPLAVHALTVAVDRPDVLERALADPQPPSNHDLEEATHADPDHPRRGDRASAPSPAR
jgi:hypothetical protein